jgi:trehalose-6-phosphate synthase
MKTIRRFNTAAAVITLITIAVPATGVSASALETRRMETEIQACVAEVGKHADYSGAKRVVHMIMDAKQKNLAQQQFTIDTAVFTAGTDNDSLPAREYRSTCVTQGALKLVDFEIARAR